MKDKVTGIIYELQATYNTEASELFKKIGQSVLTGDSQAANESALEAAKKQAKVDVLEELLERLEELE